MDTKNGKQEHKSEEVPLKVETSHIPSWKRVKRYGKNKAIKSSYFWVIFVPIAGKILPQIELFIQTYLPDSGQSINIELPFSWHLFYFSSIFFAFASLIYSTKCPHLIKMYNDPIGYREKGHGFMELGEYFIETTKNMRDRAALKEVFDSYRNIDQDGHITFLSQFWYTQKVILYKRDFWRCLCWIFYVLGFLLLLGVLIQNFLFVCREFKESTFFLKFLSVIQNWIP